MSRKCFWLTLFLLCATTAYAQVPPIASGYGANGSFTVSEARFPSPLFRDKDVVVYLPSSRANTNAPAPVIFFAPGFSVQEPDTYAPLIQHLVSRGYAVVFSPFQILLFELAEQKQRYDTIWAGFEDLGCLSADQPTGPCHVDGPVRSNATDVV